MSNDSTKSRPLLKSQDEDHQQAPTPRRTSSAYTASPASTAGLSTSFQTASATRSLSMRPTPPPSSTPPEQRISRPIGVENLLNPAAASSSTPSNNRYDRNEPESPRTAFPNPRSGPPTPSLPQPLRRQSSAGEITLPSITPPLMGSYHTGYSRSMTPRSPAEYGANMITMGAPTGVIDARQSPFISSREALSVTTGSGSSISTTASNASQAPHQPPGASSHASPQSRHSASNSQGAVTYPRIQTLIERPSPLANVSHTASRSSSPSIHQHAYQASAYPGPPTIGPGQPQSFFASPFTSIVPGGMVSPHERDPHNPSPKAIPGQGPDPRNYQMMTLETEHGAIQVPVNTQAASKVADEKRKRNATASHRFRQRRKEKEQETSHNISKLEAQVREMQEEKEHYQRERDFYQDLVQRHHIQIPQRPESPRRRRTASLSGSSMSQYQDTDTSSRSESRNIRRRTSTYVPVQGPPPHSSEPMPSTASSAPPPPQQRHHIPPFSQISAVSSEQVQASQHEALPQGPIHPDTNPFDSTRKFR